MVQFLLNQAAIEFRKTRNLVTAKCSYGLNDTVDRTDHGNHCRREFQDRETGSSFKTAVRQRVAVPSEQDTSLLYLSSLMERHEAPI